MKASLLGIIAIAGMALATPAFARGHGHGGGAHFAGHSSFSGGRSFGRPSSGARLRNSGVNRISNGTALRSRQFAARSGSSRFAANHFASNGNHHRHHHHHGGFVGAGLYGWPYYYGYGYPYGYGYGSYYGSGYASGYNGESIAVDVQSALADLGYYNGPVDGVLGAQSRRAIARFQARNGMQPTGSIDQRLVNALRRG